MTQAPARQNRPYAPRMAPDERRAQLLDTVLEIINNDGIAAVSIDAVAKRAGVTRPVVYGLFTDTDDILRGSLQREEEHALSQIASAIPSPSDDSAGALTAFTLAIVDAALAAPPRWRAIFMIADSRTPTFEKRVEHFRTQLIDRITDVIRADPTTQPADDVELLARHLFLTTWELGRLALTQPRQYPRDRIANYADTAFRSLLNRS